MDNLIENFTLFLCVFIILAATLFGIWILAAIIEVPLGSLLAIVSVVYTMVQYVVYDCRE